MTPLPHRFSEKSFRRYEPIIATVVSEFPNVTLVRPSDLELSAETVRGRLRDAITSLRTHMWQTKIDVTRFAAIYPAIVVSLRPDGMVAVGDEHTVKNQVVEPFNAIDPTNVLDCTSNPDIDMQTLCILAHNRALSKRIKIKLIPEDAKSWMEAYDIVLTPQPNDTYLLS